jgi:hypothetical protein
MTKLKTCNIRIPIETVWANIPRQERTCTFCNDNVGNQFHVFFMCNNDRIVSNSPLDEFSISLNHFWINWSCKIWAIYFTSIKPIWFSKIYDRPTSLNIDSICKRILKVRSSTPNVMVYEELGRYPLEIRVPYSILYW